MEELRIHQSPWRVLLLTLCSILMIAASVFLMHFHRNMFELFAGWIGILFFGLCCLAWLYSILKEWLMHRPFLTIKDDCLICQAPRKMVVNFADVESFSVGKVHDSAFIVIHYKPNVERQKMENASIFGYLFRSMNKQLINAHDSITTTGLSMKAEDLCNLLNKRLKQANIR
ncbi:MAG: hypothetical protein IKU02_06250 [Bacteroidaceae bacterium]|nr:hypothetical protein [Bacteroidaceae bacterium]